MKHIRLFVILAFLVVTPLQLVHAFNPDVDSPHVLAGSMPDSTEVFAATRIGSDYIAELDAILLAIYDKVPSSIDMERLTFDEAFRMGFDEEGLDWDKFSELLGNYAAVGIEPVNDFEDGLEPYGTFVVEITDQKAVDNILVAMSAFEGKLPEGRIEDGVIIYDVEEEDAQILITENQLIVTNHPNYAVNQPLTLLSRTEYTSALGMLQEDRYNGLIYVSEATVEAGLLSRDFENLREMGVNPADAGAMVAGFTILDSRAFIIDGAVQTVALVPTSTVSTGYLNAMPATTDAFVAASDLTNVYNSVISAAQAMAEANGEDDPTAMIQLGFNFTGLDLEEDVLSWTTGGYGVFIGADVKALLNDVIANGEPTELNFDAGIVIEATDVEKAKNVAAELGEFFEQITANDDSVTVTQQSVNGVDFTSIVSEVPMGRSPIVLEFVLAATDDFLFLGTRSAFDSIMSGDTLASNPDFMASVPYLLDNPTSVWYANSDATLLSSILGNDSGPMRRNRLDMEKIMSDPSTASAFVDAFGDILSNMTLTTSVDANSVVRFRGSMTLNP